MKTVLEYLDQCKNMACHNLLCYSDNYAMTKAKPGLEKQFEDARRDCEIAATLVLIFGELEKNIQPLLDLMLAQKGDDFKATVSLLTRIYCEQAKKEGRENSDGAILC